jgi:hypothetical protein
MLDGPPMTLAGTATEERLAARHQLLSRAMTEEDPGHTEREIAGPVRTAASMSSIQRVLDSWQQKISEIKRRKWGVGVERWRRPDEVGPGARHWRWCEAQPVRSRGRYQKGWSCLLAPPPTHFSDGMYCTFGHWFLTQGRQNAPYKRQPMQS